MIGKAGSGKDTVGNYLIQNCDFLKLSLAGPLKECVKALFMLDDHTVYNREAREFPLKDFPKWSVRKLLQFVGTELFRDHFDKDIWVKLLIKQVRESEIKRIVVTDVRFPNEIDGIRKMSESEGFNVKFIKVVRDGQIGLDVGLSNHASEKYDLDGDYLIDNNDTINTLHREVDRIMTKIYEERFHGHV